MIKRVDFACRLFDNLNENQLLTTKQVAQLFNIPEKTIRKWRYEGDLPAVKVGRRLVRYKLGDIQRWLNQEGAKR